MKVIGIARNYKKHAEELNNPLPIEPVFFMMPQTSLLHNNRPFYFPDFSNEIDHEVEIVLKICRIGKHIHKQFAPRYYTEIGLGIDFTARDLQHKCMHEGLPWEPAKAFDNSAPVSKFVSKDEFENIYNLNFSLNLNQKTVQEGNTFDMLFNFDEIIAYISKFVTLKIGDLIFTGTPAGVGPVKIGDRVQGYIEDKKMLDFEIK